MKRKSIFEYMSSPNKTASDKNLDSPQSQKQVKDKQKSNSIKNKAGTQGNSNISESFTLDKFFNKKVTKCINTINTNETTSKDSFLTEKSYKEVNNFSDDFDYSENENNINGVNNKFERINVNTPKRKLSSSMKKEVETPKRKTFDKTEILIKKNKEDPRFNFLIDIKDKNGNSPLSQNYDCSSLFIDESEYKRFTPFEKQFWDIKKEYFDTIIFFKKGKFYELYENDADIANKEFGLRITDRVNMRMAGVPESSFEFWSEKFLSKGYKIGRVEQSENMIGKGIRERNLDDQNIEKVKKEDKIIKRELKEVITQGTVYKNISHLSFYIAVLMIKKDKTHILIYDASINEIQFESFCDQNNTKLNTIFAQFKILEIITDEKIKLDNFVSVLKPIKGGSLIKFSERFENEEEYICFLYLKNYMEYLKRENFVDHVKIRKLHQNNKKFMILDSTTLKNMDIIEENNKINLYSEKSLFSTIDFCLTNQGKRELKRWLISPLYDIADIQKRHKIVNIFENIDTSKLKEIMKEIGDFERTLTRLFSENPNLKDFCNFLKDIESCNNVIVTLNLLILQNFGENNVKDEEKYSNTFFESMNLSKSDENIKKNEVKNILHGKDLINAEFIDSFPDCNEIINFFRTNYEINEKEIISHNKNDEIYEMTNSLQNIEKKLLSYLEEQKKILKCNICYKDLGKEIFQLEISNSQKVPNNYFLVSSTKSHKRYYTNDLKIIVNEYIECEELLFQCKRTLLRRVASELAKYKESFYIINDIISKIDCYISFSTYQSLNSDLCYPEFCESFSFIGMRNPIYKNFVDNDLMLEEKVLILSGPNMGGKSTFLRTVCLNIILSQIGLKVSCKKFKSSLFDMIFTRIGASDNLMRGESTFMIELKETSDILRQCTENSILFIDELGRGTSTKDGECIARSCLEYIKRKKSFCLFSTHYHEMIEEVENVKKGYMKTIFNEDIIFLYKLVEGICNDSHGIEIAKLAGVPISIVERAKEIKSLLK
ncbi:DNA mismatch repair protein msh6 [Gurleya vavrai]